MVVALEAIQEEPIAPFYIPATASILEKQPRMLKHGNCFAMFNHYGDISGERGSPEGVYHKDTRILSMLTLDLNGERPLLLSSHINGRNALLSVNLTNPDFAAEGRIVLPRDTIYLLRSKFLWNGTHYERVSVHNYDIHSHCVTVGLQFACDFADLFEIRGQQRKARGRMRVDVSREQVRYIYHGLDGVMRIMTLHFEPLPDAIDRSSARFYLELGPKQRRLLFFSSSCTEHNEAESERRYFLINLRASRARLKSALSHISGIDTSNELFNEFISSAANDLVMLITHTEQGPYPYAGIPWYSCPFGRDAIITAIEMLWADPGLAAGVLRFLAHWQAREINIQADAEPGKILHEMRFSEMARLKEVPFGLYYGSVDSTPLFVILAGMYYERTGDVATITELWPHIEAALHWMDTYGDADGDGFIEYGQKESGGLRNQGWKDSHDAIFHADGSMAPRPIALCEVQGYAYAARRYAAGLAAGLGRHDLASALNRKADALKMRFHEAFWCEEIGTYALALDGDKKPCRVRTSNAGQLLFTGIVEAPYAGRMVQQLMAEDFFTGWGIRTVATGEVRYNPMSYHNGSVWPHDNALIALGMARCGFMREAQSIMVALFNAAIHMDMGRLPELFCGFSRRPARQPTPYPVACIPQAWACATPFCLLQACLGIGFNAAEEEVRLFHPVLPDCLDEIILRGLRAGECRMDIRLQRHGSEVAASILRRTGKGRLAVTL